MQPVASCDGSERRQRHCCELFAIKTVLVDQFLLFCVQNSKVFLLKTQNPEFAILISVDVTISEDFY